MTSALFSVNGSTVQQAHAVAFGGTASLAVANTAGVRQVEWTIAGTSRSGLASPVITAGGSPSGVTATFSMPADPLDGEGRSFLVECLVNGGRDANGVSDPALRVRRVVGAASSAGYIPATVNERDERNATHGWLELLNGALKGQLVYDAQEIATTTNATPTNIDLDVLDGAVGNLNVIGVRVCGQTAGNSMILRDMVVAIRGDGSGWLKVGGSGSDGPYSDSGIVYVNDDANLSTANITCTSVSGGNLRVTVTGVAATTIVWTAQAWVQVIV